jgi:hypothetical protein
MYIFIRTKGGGEALNKVLTKDREMQWKIIEEEAILDHYTSKPNMQEFAQITIDGNDPRLFVELLALKSKVMSI